MPVPGDKAKSPLRRVTFGIFPASGPYCNKEAEVDMPITLVTTPVPALVRAANSGVKTKAAQVAVRSTILMLAVLCSTAAPAKDRQWKDAKVIDITSEKGAAVIVPIAAFVGVPIAKTYYWIQTADTIYVVGPVLTKHQLLNVTLHGPTRIVVDGNNAHILDDDGKDRRMPVVEKVARPKSEDSQ